MLNDLAADAQVYLVTGYTDLRRGIDGLATIVQAQLRLDPFSKALFLFCGRRCDRIKGLLWEGDGFLPVRTSALTTEDSSGRAVRPKQ
ncbi:IS66 family insertion sequence element accessory protein TnpB [Ruminococcus albus]|uniref:IS66 family insertion sequence element accessory protein TnpB n=1 Tax=Ruminococcus albus TaxID=1264 RepID=UPI0002D600C2|nr:IS66 family insertion sequence element accessory protein TnpB [Ruminococcus albus]